MRDDDWQWRYLCPDGNTFWDWNAEGDAVVWWNGETLALYEELSMALERLRPHGLPRWEELLLVLAATRRTWPEADGQASLFTGKIQQLDPQGWKDFPIFKWLKPLYDGLNRAHRLARREGFGSAVSLAVIEAVFGGRKGALTAEQGAELVDAFRSGEVSLAARLFSRSTNPSGSRIPPLGLLTTVRNLVRTLGQLDEHLDLRVFERTGLNAPVQPAPLEDIPWVERLRGLVRELLEEPGECRGAARVARQLEAVLQLPRRLSDPQDQPVGGYSDVANRGAMDRLLISELAQDPDVLAMRVALNEALYLRREAPPAEPAAQRVVLMDTGIRMWGRPRVFACGVALALAMRIDSAREVSIYTPRRDAAQTAKVDSREGVVELMSRLRPEPEPGRALASLFRERAGEEAEFFLITTGRVWSDPLFQRTIRPAQPERFFVALVEEDGAFRLLSVAAAGERELQRARLEPGELLAETSRPATLPRLKDGAGELPRFLTMTECPLRLAAGIAADRAIFHHEVGLLAHDTQGVLRLWSKPDLGAQLVTTQMPRGRPVWSEICSEARRASFLLDRGDGTVLLFEVGLDSGEHESTRIRLPFARVEGVLRVADVVVLFGNWDAFAFRVGTGRCLGRARLPGRFVRLQEHFARCGTEWFALLVMSFSDDAQALARHVKSIPLNERASSVLAFERLPCAGAEAVWTQPEWPAPLAIDPDLRVRCLDDPPTEVKPPERQRGEFLGLSSDGLRVCLRMEDGRVLDYDLLRQLPRSIFGQPDLFGREPAAFEIRRMIPNLRKRVGEVLLAPPAGLHLRTPGDELLSLTIAGGRRKRIIWRKERFYEGARRRGWLRSVDLQGGQAQWDSRVKAAEFTPLKAHSAGRFRLERIDFPDGSRMWLDGRGLLHLKSAESSLPEIAIVLKDGETAGWCSDGHWFGSRYFIGGRRSQPEVAFACVERFVAGVLQWVERHAVAGGADKGGERDD